MKVVILAAGRGKRMGELTASRPKPLLEYRGKSLIAHTLDLVHANCSEIIIVVGYLGEMIRQAVGPAWKGVPVHYVESDMKGTGEALWKAKSHLVDTDFLVFPADDIYSAEDIDKLAQLTPSILVSEVKSGSASGGMVTVRESSGSDKYSEPILDSIEEGTHQAPFLVCAGSYHLTSEIFAYPLMHLPGRDEYGLPQTVVEYSRDFKVHLINATSWKQVVGPKDLEG